MKKSLRFMQLAIFVLTVYFLTSCAQKDIRFLKIPATLVDELEYPVKVKVLKVDASTYDVEASEGRFIAVTGVNSQLLELDRYEKASLIVLRRHVESDAKIEKVSMHTPHGSARCWMRFKITKP